MVFFLILIGILAIDFKLFARFFPNQIPLVKGTTSHQWTRQREADSTQNVDILVVGSSLAQSIDVRKFQHFNLRAFNFASGSLSPIQTSFLFKKYLNSFNP